jgi:hypothetical protein
LISQLRSYLANSVFRKVLVRLSEVDWPMSVSAIFAKTAHFLIFVKLAFLGFEVVVRDVKQLELHFYREGLHL